MIKQIVEISTLAVAVLALVLSSVSYVRENERAETIAEREETRARAQVKPLLYIVERRYDAGYGVRLKNAGVGPAFITNAVFQKNGQKTHYLVNLFYGLEVEKWDDYVSLPSGAILEPGKSWDLVKLSSKDLKPQYLKFEKGIEFEIQYKDIYGNPMEVVKGTLSGE
ncbi:hypothetical protein [Bacterioplanoides sp.]|uniref:hypothetical protein n=1 Tax=Bacterioplanoides sp. TaxID=2066072 RepID=UPI003B5CA115